MLVAIGELLAVLECHSHAFAPADDTAGQVTLAVADAGGDAHGLVGASGDHGAGVVPAQQAWMGDVRAVDASTDLTGEVGLADGKAIKAWTCAMRAPVARA